MNNIYLIGMPGCGKSTIGKILSCDTGLGHIDADVYLEQKFDDTIAHIFEACGEADFRKKETLTIQELSKLDNIIVSTGGGVVTTLANKEYMNNSGIIVFIDSMPQTILSNSSLKGRPLLKNKDRIYELYNQRIELYRDFADITIDNNGAVEDVILTLKQALKEINYIK